MSLWSLRRRHDRNLGNVASRRCAVPLRSVLLQCSHMARVAWKADLAAGTDASVAVMTVLRAFATYFVGQHAPARRCWRPGWSNAASGQHGYMVPELLAARNQIYLRRTVSAEAPCDIPPQSTQLAGWRFRVFSHG